MLPSFITAWINACDGWADQPSKNERPYPLTFDINSLEYVNG